jgi:hypothetical protein
LNTISSDGCKDSTVVNVSIFALPDSVFTIIQKLNTLILKAKDTALVSYLWDFGNGAMPGNGFKVDKTYFDTG